MSVTAAQVAEAVKVALNAGTFSLEFTAKRVYLPMENLEALEDLAVFVTAKSDEWLGMASRKLRQNDISVDIGIFQRFATTVDPKTEAANAALDPLAVFVKEIASSFQPGKLTGLDANWVRTVNEPIYDAARLKDNRLFASLVTVTYRESHSL